MILRILISLVIIVGWCSAGDVGAQSRKVRVAMPGYTIAGISFLTAKLNGYYAAEGLDVELIAMRAPTANLAVVGGSVEFSTVPPAGLNTALRGGALKIILVHFDKPQHLLSVKNELQNLRIDEPIAAKVYDSSRPTMTADGTLSDDTQKKMATFVAKSSGLRAVVAADKAFDFSFVGKANAALHAKGWQPGS